MSRRRPYPLARNTASIETRDQSAESMSSARVSASFTQSPSIGKNVLLDGSHAIAPVRGLAWRWPGPIEENVT